MLLAVALITKLAMFSIATVFCVVLSIRIKRNTFRNFS